MSACKIPAFDIFVCMDEKGGIGKNGDLPWERLKEDMEYFREETNRGNSQKRKNIVLMGRRTYESIPEKHRPLKKRLNIILSRDKGMTASFYSYSLPNSNRMVKERRNFVTPGVFYVCSMDEAFTLISLLREAKVSTNHSIKVIGGGLIYEYFLREDIVKNCRHMYITRVHDTFDCDTFFPVDAFNRAIINNKFSKVMAKDYDSSEPHYTIEKYIKKK